MASVTSSSSPLTPPRIHQQNVRPFNNDTRAETPAATINHRQQFQHHKDQKDYPFSDMDSKEYIERYSKIEADYRHRLMAKYFSDKDIFGDSVFDGVKIINGETIKTSRVHCAQSYADPVQYLKVKKSRSYPPAETQTSLSNGKHSMKEEMK